MIYLAAIMLLVCAFILSGASCVAFKDSKGAR